MPVNKCLKCGKSFKAINQYNRICAKCKKSNTYINSDLMPRGKTRHYTKKD